MKEYVNSSNSTTQRRSETWKEETENDKSKKKMGEMEGMRLKRRDVLRFLTVTLLYIFFPKKKI